MQCTPSGDRRHALQRTARELARDARALQKAVHHAPATRRESQRTRPGGRTCLSGRWRRSSIPARDRRSIATGWLAGARAARRAMCTWGAAGKWMQRRCRRLTVPLGFHAYFLTAGLISSVILEPPFMLMISMIMSMIALALHREAINAGICPNDIVEASQEVCFRAEGPGTPPSPRHPRKGGGRAPLSGNCGVSPPVWS